MIVTVCGGLAGQEDEESISIHTLVRLLCHYASFVTRANGDIDAATKIYQKALQVIVYFHVVVVYWEKEYTV